MFFKNLVPVLEKMDLQFTVQLRDGKITFMAIPTKLDGKAFDMKPLTGSGTPEALDKGFAGAFDQVIGKNVDLILNLEEVEASIKNRKAKATTPASTATATKTTTPATPVKKTFLESKPVKTNKTEVKLWEEIKKAGEEMGKRIKDNPDMYNFYWNSIKDKPKLIKSIKGMETLAKEYFDGIRDSAMEKEETSSTPTGPTGPLFEGTSAETVLPDDSKTKKEDKPKAKATTPKKKEEPKVEPEAAQPHIETSSADTEDDGFNSVTDDEATDDQETDTDNSEDTETEDVDSDTDNTDDDVDEDSDENTGEEESEIEERDPDDEDAGVDGW
jgi:PRTRC genetic system protein E